MITAQHVEVVSTVISSLLAILPPHNKLFDKETDTIYAAQKISRGTRLLLRPIPPE
jgi:hypothetical protein